MKTILCFLALLCLVLSGCISSIEKEVRKLPPFNLGSWTHEGKYGAFTDKVTITGASWVLNNDGSATVTIKEYDGEATYAGSVGPHDIITNFSLTFPPGSPQAQVLTMATSTGVPLKAP